MITRSQISPLKSTALTAAAALLLLATASGCTIFGYASKTLSGPPTHYALYVPEKEPAAVVVENYQSGSGYGLDPDQIAVFTCAQLRSNNVAPVIDSTDVYDLRARDPKKFRGMSMAEIGRAVGAKQVIYVDLEHSAMEGPIGSKALRGGITARVRVIDAETGATRWPQAAEGGYPLSFQSTYIEQQPGRDADAIRESVNRSAADAIAKLFYTWQEPG